MPISFQRKETPIEEPTISIRELEMRASNVMSGATMWEFCSCHFKNEEPRLNVNVNVKNNQNFKIRTNFLLVDIKILIDVNKKVQKLISATCCLFQESIIMWTQFYPHSNTDKGMRTLTSNMRCLLSFQMSLSCCLVCLELEACKIDMGSS